MAQTYVEGARIVIVSKDKDNGEYKLDVREGRQAIHDLYRDLYKNRNEPIKPRNNVEFARRVAPDLLVIHGTFEPTAGQGDAYPFVQVRKREGEKWLIVNLELFITPEP
jgi:hypothetical protein